VAALAGERRPLALGLAAYTAAGWHVSRARERATPAATTAALAGAHLAYGTGVVLGALSPSLADGPLGDRRVR
jgi:hypothetical protein